jgi:hypothetical protein
MNRKYVPEHVRLAPALASLWGALMLAIVLAGCAQPHRFDPLRQQQLQQQQDECLRRGGSPKECRP